MLDFREIDYQKDILEAVNLIKIGLDSSYTKKFFCWKHVENPFGRSYGFVATDKGKIVGLRMFMFWQFYNPKTEKILTALRPVDTVVDENYRGQGLFKKLTLQGLKECQKKYDLIFNTPNENSLPGYLKMGWALLNNGPNIKIGLLNPFFKKAKIQKIDIGSLDLGKNYGTSNLIWQSNRTGKFLKWRYEDEKYTAVQCGNGLMIFSVTKMKGFKTIIVFELLGDSKQFQEMINAIGKKENAPFVYFIENEEFESVKCIASTIRKRSNIVFKSDSTGVQNNINFSLGDIEGKL